jgi:hypothetical protein
MRNVLLDYAITKEAGSTAQSTEDKREKIQALSLAKECYSMKLELLTNATVVDDAIMFVSGKSKERLKEPDYDEDEDQLEEEQEREAGKITSTTTNLVL